MRNKFDIKKTKEVLSVLNGLSNDECQGVLDAVKDILNAHFKQTELRVSDSDIETMVNSRKPFEHCTLNLGTSP